MKKVNPIIQWWVTPKLPPEDTFAKHNIISQWLIHPIKRRLARIYLKLLQKFTNIKVIGITGSTGKTTTTEILASILGKAGKTVCSAEGIDTVYNIPNSILRVTPGTKYLVLEMSVEYINEMDFYLWLARLDAGIVTNISTTHTEFLKSREGVAAEKGKMIKSLGKGGFAVLNKEDKGSSDLAGLTHANVVYFGRDSDVSAVDVKLNGDLSTDFTLKIGEKKKRIHMDAFGNQFVINALGAAAVANALKIDMETIAAGISGFERSTHRLNIFTNESYGMIFDDTYNSNPKALSESLDTFGVIAKGKKKIAVIGDMLELGSFEEEAHRELGKKTGQMAFDCIVGVGNAARFFVDEASRKGGCKNCFLVSDYKEALQVIKPVLGRNTALFVKGSRSIHLDKLVDELMV